MVTGRTAYVINIVSTNALLTRRDTIRWRHEFTCKIRFQRRHASTDEEQARIIFRNQRKAVKNQMFFAFEEF